MPKSGNETFRPTIRYEDMSVADPDIMVEAICASVGQTNTSAQGTERPWVRRITPKAAMNGPPGINLTASIGKKAREIV